MYVNPALKYEKDIFSYKGKNIKKHINLSFFHLTSLFKFFIKRPLFNLRKQSESGLFIKESRLDYLGDNNEVSNYLRFEISSKKMNELLVQRQICAADIRCLDTNSKQCLKKLCLNTCLFKPASQHQDELNLPDSLVRIEHYDF